MSKPVDKPKRRRWPLPRWSMKAMFVIITIICLVFGLVSRRAEQQKRAISSLRAVYGVKYHDDFKIYYDYQLGELLGPMPDAEPPGPAWLRDAIGVDHFANIARVELESSQFRNDHLRLLSHFRKLKSLHLRDCDSITDDGLKHLMKLTSLTELGVYETSLTTLPPEIGQLTNLTWLGLDENRLTKLPPEVEKLTDLEALWVSNNLFTTIPREIWGLTKLETLVFDENRLTTLPPEIGNLKKLQWLWLHNNQLTMIPPEIGQLTKLTILSLDGNQLTTLPPEIGQLTNLTKLYLGGNDLTTLPSEIGNLTNLRSLRLDGNPITDEDLEHLKSLKNLEDLSLLGTKVTKEGVADLQRALPKCSIVSDF